MTVKRQWMLVLVLSAILSVLINSAVLSSLINRYYVDYSKSNYEQRYQQIIEFTKKALQERYTGRQLSVQLETHLIDPILKIRVYDANGNLLADVGGMHDDQHSGMMNGGVENFMMGTPAQEVDSTEISEGGVKLGRLELVRYSSGGNSLQNRMFVFALIRSSIFSFGIAVVLTLIAGSLISGRMSRDLRNTAIMATNIDLGDETNIEQSKVREIRIIQQSLDTLQSKLKLRQISRKRLLDEMVHQARTPLTVLRTHLEGFEDGILSMTPEEIRTCEAQIDSLTAIITNISAMIDTERDTDLVQIEDVEINQLLKQIIGALKLQFGKKQIELALLSHNKLSVRTDRYKLSQSIYNLLTNAYKFTGPDGKVSVSYQALPEGFRIVIEDTGSGISAEDRAHLFDAYFRGANAAGVPGEGIGLYVVKENLEQINGRIDVESAIGKGSRFILTISDAAPGRE